MAEEALALHLKGMEEDGEAIPAPSSLEAVMSDDNNRAGIAVLVPEPEAADKVLRVNITLPESLIKRIDAVRDNRSRFLAQAAERALQDA
jgi:hypothetical protein